MTLSGAAQRIYDRWEPYWAVDTENGGALEAIADAIGTNQQPVDDVARDTDTHEAWHALFDPWATPVWALPWLAQIVGVTLLPSDTEAQQRDRISQAAGFYRGTQRAIREEIARLLTGTQTVRIVKSGPWALSVIVRQTEAPETDWKARVNLATNPKAGAGATTGWTNTSLDTFAAVTLGSGGAPAPSLELAGLGVTTGFHGVGSATLDRARIDFPVVSGHTYRIAVYVNLHTNSATGVGFRVDNAGGTAKVSSVTLTALDTWTRLDAGVTADATENWTLRLQQLGAGAVDFYWTAVLIEEAPLTGAYFDGSVPGYAWSGTANQSTSQRTLTTKVRTAALRQKPAGVNLSVVISDEPIIDEFTRTINSITATIDSLTLPDVT